MLIAKTEAKQIVLSISAWQVALEEKPMLNDN